MMGELPSKIGPYRIVRGLGEGGMGAVYEAVHETIERRVAIKVLHPEYAANTEFTARFFNEARAVNRVEHPGLVQISDYGQQPDGTAYIVMEYLKGESLSHRVERCGGKLTTAEVIHLSGQIADALAAAHAKDIVHRDLKPENVMLVPEPHMPGGERTKLLDFGIAKVAEQGDGPRVQTKTSQLMGTPIYMSPEQCEGAGRVDAKSDVYSLGVMMFEMLAGKPPFDADGPGKILGMHMFMAPPTLKDVAPDVPVSLADLVSRLLVKDREKRPRMTELLAELLVLAEKYPLPRPADSAHHGVVLPVDPLSATQIAPRSSTLEASASQAATRPARRSLRLAAFLTVCTLLFIAAIAGLILSRTPKYAMIFGRLRQAVHLALHAADPDPAPPLTKPQPAGENPAQQASSANPADTSATADHTQPTGAAAPPAGSTGSPAPTSTPEASKNPQPTPTDVSAKPSTQAQNNASAKPTISKPKVTKFTALKHKFYRFTKRKTYWKKKR